jgi:hypothetical protein
LLDALHIAASLADVPSVTSAKPAHLSLGAHLELVNHSPGSLGSAHTNQSGRELAVFLHDPIERIRFQKLDEITVSGLDDSLAEHVGGSTARAGNLVDFRNDAGKFSSGPVKVHLLLELADSECLESVAQEPVGNCIDTDVEEVLFLYVGT